MGSPMQQICLCKCRLARLHRFLLTGPHTVVGHAEVNLEIYRVP